MHLSITVAVIFSLSILIAGIIALFRFAQIRDIYHPFIYLVWVACINELLTVYLVVLKHQFSIINYTIYSLFEALLLLWFFKGLGSFKSKRGIFYFLIILFVGVWIVESFFANRFTNFTYYFDILYAFCLVLLSIRTVNDLLFTEKELLKNPTFLICVGIILYFTYQIIEKMFSLYGLKESKMFKQNIQSILMIVNLLSNLIYALAVLWMRKRQAFTLEF